jgi:hypothetical protein
MAGVPAKAAPGTAAATARSNGSNPATGGPPSAGAGGFTHPPRPRKKKRR